MGKSFGTAYLIIIFVYECICYNVAIIRSTVLSCDDDLRVLKRTIFKVQNTNDAAYLQLPIFFMYNCFS